MDRFVAFDESGNTGQNLLDPSQPHFVLSSVHLSNDDALALCSLASSGMNECHFAELKKRPRGRERIKEFLRSPLFTPDSVKLFVVHKPFMVITKLVDLLIETLLFEANIDLYEQGGNIALANLLHTVTPVLCGEERFSQLRAAFVEMIRTKDAPSIASFYQTVECLRESCSDKQFLSVLYLLRDTRAIIEGTLKKVDVTTLDPAIPVFVLLCSKWGDQFGGPFRLVHDDSKPLAHAKDDLERLMDAAIPVETAGSGRQRMNLPLKATGIDLVDSTAMPQVQVADLLAGATAYMLKNRDDQLSKVIGPVVLPLTLGGIWPDSAVTPQELDTEELGESVVDGIGRFFARQRRIRDDESSKGG